jgi:hypothetical protein
MTIIEQLPAFNRKERFFLIGKVLGNPEFRLDESFRIEVANTLQLNIPHDAYTTMDYHLEWIYATLVLAQNMEPTMHMHSTEITGQF